MTSTETQWLALTGHPATHTEAARSVDVRVRRSGPATLEFQYVLRAEMPRIRVPLAQPPRRADGLWKHTCFEAFIATPDEPGYDELNFSPSGQWAAYRFSAYREGMAAADVATPPELTVRRFDDRLEIDAVVGFADRVTPRAGRTLKLALSVVVEDEGGTLTYWALKHPPGKPDFHHSDGFAVELPL